MMGLTEQEVLTTVKDGGEIFEISGYQRDRFQVFNKSGKYIGITTESVKDKIVTALGLNRIEVGIQGEVLVYGIGLWV
jgi:hypothetical protein